MSVMKCMTRQECLDDAEAQGLVCFFGEPDELLIDLDDGNRINKMVREVLGPFIDGELVTVSKGGRGSHVYYKLNRSLSLPEASALQAALGSDPVREALTILQEQDFSLLHENKLQAERVIAWRESCKV